MGAALAMALLDFFSIAYFDSRMLGIPVALGVLAGIGWALTERLPTGAVAQSVDRRGGLHDRLTTATEVPLQTGTLADALHDDARSQLDRMRPAVLYPLRLGRWHGVFVVLGALSAGLFLLGNTFVFRSDQAKKEAAELKQAAVAVERVAKPVLEAAKRPDADARDKELARRLQRFTFELRKARMTRPEALVKANQLAEQAKTLETARAQTLAGSITSAQTAAAKLQQRAERARLEKSDTLKLAEQAAVLESEIAAMERKLAEAKAGRSGLSEQEKAALARQRDAAKKRLGEIRLSQQAQAFLQKLQAMPEIREAQKLLSQLAEQSALQQAGQPSAMTPEQLEAAAKRLEALARQFDTDAEMKELARQLLEAAKNAQACKSGQCSGGLLGAFGLGVGAGQGPAGLSLGSKGRGGVSEDRWVGAHGSLSQDDKSSLLRVKFEDRVIASQVGAKGPETYTEVLGPSTPGARSSVPFQKVLPRYEKSAQSALAKDKVPPKLQGKVRDYFDSLRK